MTSSFMLSQRFSSSFDLEKFGQLSGQPVGTLEFKNETNQIQAVMIEQELYRLVYDQQQIVRRKSELFHTLENMFLEEHSALIKAELAEFQSTPEADRTGPLAQREKELTHRHMEIVKARDAIIKDYDIERLRLAEEDDEFLAELEYRQRLWFEDDCGIRAQQQQPANFEALFAPDAYNAFTSPLLANGLQRREDSAVEREMLPQLKMLLPHGRDNSNCTLS